MCGKVVAAYGNRSSLCALRGAPQGIMPIRGENMAKVVTILSQDIQSGQLLNVRRAPKTQSVALCSTKSAIRLP